MFLEFIVGTPTPGQVCGSHAFSGLLFPALPVNQRNLPAQVSGLLHYPQILSAVNLGQAHHLSDQELFRYVFNSETSRVKCASDNRKYPM
jgi:hypothetical protein